eukprot:1541468-Amphidinium_carterae.1
MSWSAYIEVSHQRVLPLAYAPREEPTARTGRERRSYYLTKMPKHGKNKKWETPVFENTNPLVAVFFFPKNLWSRVLGLCQRAFARCVKHNTVTDPEDPIQPSPLNAAKPEGKFPDVRSGIRSACEFGIFSAFQFVAHLAPALSYH